MKGILKTKQKNKLDTNLNQYKTELQHQNKIK